MGKYDAFVDKNIVDMMMNIGFVSTWYERGAAYVTRQYIELLKEKHQVFVYARAGEKEKANQEWNQDYVTWGKQTAEYGKVVWSDLKKWIQRNQIEVVLFNEQQRMDILADIKLHMPTLKIGAYIDYYRRDTIEKHKIYDFLICNTRRHFETFQWHPQCYYVPWGTDVELFRYREREGDEVIFFHSMGRSTRKGTNILLETFLHTDLCEKSQLIIHTQLDELRKQGYDYMALKAKNVEVIEQTVTAPGLYHMGDVYVYPCELDGLGLSIYEAFSCGMPVIGTDVPPINEPINETNGRLVKVAKSIAREDGYYWPLSLVDQDDLYRQMRYYVDNKGHLKEIRQKVREGAVQKLNWKDRTGLVNDIFEKSILSHEYDDEYLRSYKNKKSLGQKLDYFTGTLRIWGIIR